ncbi:hypothetical protein N0V85_009955, partial [Neurospora sp. IMI 360204]
MAPPRTRASASARAQDSSYHEHRDNDGRDENADHSSDGEESENKSPGHGEDDQTFNEGDAGNEGDKPELSKEEEEATTKPGVDKKKKVVTDKTRKPQRIDPVIRENARAFVKFNEENLNSLCPLEERSRG